MKEAVSAIIAKIQEAAGKMQTVVTRHEENTKQIAELQAQNIELQNAQFSLNGIVAGYEDSLRAIDPDGIISKEVVAELKAVEESLNPPMRDLKSPIQAKQETKPAPEKAATTKKIAASPKKSTAKK